MIFLLLCFFEVECMFYYLQAVVSLTFIFCKMGINISPKWYIFFCGEHEMKWCRILQTFFVKGQVVCIFSFVGHMVFVITIQICYCGIEAVIDNMQMNVHGYVKLFLCFMKYSSSFDFFQSFENVNISLSPLVIQKQVGTKFDPSAIVYRSLQWCMKIGDSSKGVEVLVFIWLKNILLYLGRFVQAKGTAGLLSYGG